MKNINNPEKERRLLSQLIKYIKRIIVSTVVNVSRFSPKETGFSGVSAGR